VDSEICGGRPSAATPVREMNRAPSALLARIFRRGASRSRTSCRDTSVNCSAQTRDMPGHAGRQIKSTSLAVALILIALETCATRIAIACTIPNGFPSCNSTAKNCTVVFKFNSGQQCTAYGPYAPDGNAPAAMGVDCTSNGNVTVLWATASGMLIIRLPAASERGWATTVSVGLI
jgi:hypothetical protein